MNRELMLRVADAIEAHPERFDMDQWIFEKPCGTGGCIAGTTVILAHGDKRPEYLEYSAQQLLDLTDEEAVSLFYIDEWPEDLWDAVHDKLISEAQAAAHLLRRMAGSEGG